jgi:ketosteroid isomerase-like protein
MSDLEAQVRVLIDRQAIADCVHRYARGIDREDIELVASCYHPDAIDDHGSYVGPGRGLGEWAFTTHKGFARTQHHITNQVVDLDGDTAHVETYYLVVRRADDGTDSLCSGRYIDRFERRDGEWRIAARVCMTETVGEFPGVDMSGADRYYAPGSKDRTDLSYMRPLVVSRKSADEPHVRS